MLFSLACSIGLFYILVLWFSLYFLKSGVLDVSMFFFVKCASTSCLNNYDFLSLALLDVVCWLLCLLQKSV